MLRLDRPGQRADLDEQDEHQRRDAGRPRVAAAHDVEGIGAVVGGAEAVGGVGEPVEVQAAAAEGDGAERQPGRGEGGQVHGLPGEDHQRGRRGQRNRGERREQHGAPATRRSMTRGAGTGTVVTGGHSRGIPQRLRQLVPGSESLSGSTQVGGVALGSTQAGGVVHNRDGAG